MYADDPVPYGRRTYRKGEICKGGAGATLFRWLGRGWDPEHKGWVGTFDGSRDTSHNATGKETKRGSTNPGRRADRQAQGWSPSLSGLVFYVKYYKRS